MKTIVIYNTQTGFTKQYAEYIAQKLGCLCWPMRGLYSQILEDYDLVIFGSWVMDVTFLTVAVSPVGASVVSLLAVTSL